jgi:hypothetical protein
VLFFPAVGVAVLPSPSATSVQHLARILNGTTPVRAELHRQPVWIQGGVNWPLSVEHLPLNIQLSPIVVGAWLNYLYKLIPLPTGGNPLPSEARPYAQHLMWLNDKARSNHQHRIRDGCVLSAFKCLLLKLGHTADSAKFVITQMLSRNYHAARRLSESVRYANRQLQIRMGSVHKDGAPTAVNRGLNDGVYITKPSLHTHGYLHVLKLWEVVTMHCVLFASPL